MLKPCTLASARRAFCAPVLAALGLAALSVSTPSHAQQDPFAPAGFSGTLVEYSDSSVTLRDKDGKLVTVAMTPGWTVSTSRALDSAAIKQGDFIASANSNVDADTGKSTEVRIFEPGYKPEEGTHPMGQPTMSMTHGTVTSATRGAAGVDVTVAFPNGTRHLIVPPDVKVTGFDLHARSTLQPGAKISGVTRKGPDGVPRAGRLVTDAP